MGDHLSGAALALLGMAILVSLSFSYTMYDGALYCNTTCADCVSALNNDSYETVYLNSTLSSPGATCINNPAGFSNKTFDCQGYSITGNKASSTYGIYLNSKTNATIRNCTMEAFHYNLRLYHIFNSTVTNITSFNATVDCAYLYNFTNSSFSNNTLYNCSHEGMSLDLSINSTIANNTIYETVEQCIEMRDSHYNTIEYNLFHGCSAAVDFHSVESSYNLVRNNTIYDVTAGIALYKAFGNVIANNTINGPYTQISDYAYDFIWTQGVLEVSHCDNMVQDNFGPGGLPIYYSNETVNWDGLVAAQIILCDADNSVVTNSVVNASGTGYPPFAANFVFRHCDNLTVSSSVAELGHFELFYCNNATLSGNTAYGDLYAGFADYVSNGTYFYNNTAYNNNGTGFLIRSDNATLEGNTAYDNGYYGVLVQWAKNYPWSYTGVNSSGANLTSNNVYGNKFGGILIMHSQNATLSGNNIHSNGYGFVPYSYPMEVFYYSPEDRYFGIYVGLAYNVSLSGNTVHSNNYYGIAINDSNNITSTGDTVYENGLSEIITSASSPSNVSFSSLTLHPYGYPTISFPDELEANTAYTIKQVSPPTTTRPDSLSVVEGRMINITNVTGSPTITSMIWDWGAQQEGTYDESTFDLWKYVTSWADLNATMNSTANTLNYSSISMGAYGILGAALAEDEGNDVEEAEPECESDPDCAECHYCSIANGKCMVRSTAGCTTNADCAAGYNCTGCECVQAGCAYDSESPAGNECKDNSCMQIPPQEPGTEDGGEGEGGVDGEDGGSGTGGTAGNITGGQGEPRINATEPSQSHYEAEVPSASEGEEGAGGMGASSEPPDLAGAGGIVLVLLIVAGIVYFFYMGKG